MDWRIIFLLATVAAIHSEIGAADVASNGTATSSPLPSIAPKATEPELKPEESLQQQQLKNLTAVEDHSAQVKPDVNGTLTAHGSSSSEDKGNSHCCGRELRACLSSSGDGSNGMLSLEVTGHNVFHVSIAPPSFLRAQPSEFTTEKGKPVRVQIEIEDLEAAKSYQGPAKIVLKSEEGPCEVSVPSFSRSNLLHGFTYSSIRTPVVGLGMLGVAVVVVVAWAYCLCNRDSRKTLYQELEMSDHHDEPVLPTSRSHVTITINGSSNQAQASNWDEGWDDDWEDTAAAAARPSFSSSTLPLNARKVAKDGWDD